MALNIDALRKKLAETKKRTEGNGNNDQEIKWFAIQKGQNIVRILPPKEDGGDFYTEVHVHYNLGLDGKRQVVCPNHQEGKPCPVCELIEELKKGTPEEQQLAKDYKVKLKYYYNVMDTSLTEKDDRCGEVQVMSTGVQVFEQILGIICNPIFGDITDPDNGRDILLNKDGKGRNTSYSVQAHPQQTAVEYEFEDSLVDTSVFATPRSYDDIVYFLENGEFPKHEEGEEKKEEAPKRRRTAPKQESKVEEDPFDTSNIEDISDDDDPFSTDDDDDEEDEIEKEIAKIMSRKRNS